MSVSLLRPMGIPAVTNVTIQNGALVKTSLDAFFSCVPMDVLLTMCRQPPQDSAHFLIFRELITGSVIASSPRENPPACRGLLVLMGLHLAPFLYSVAATWLRTTSSLAPRVRQLRAQIRGPHSTLGNALRNNVVRPSSVFLDEFDVYIGNLFPGTPAGAINVTGGVHATE